MAGCWIAMEKWSLVLLGIVVVQCATMQPQQRYPEPPVKPEIHVKRGTQGTVSITFALSGSGDDASPSLRFVRSIKSITVVIRLPDTDIADTLRPILSSSGQISEERNTASLTIHGEALWDNPRGVEFGKVEVRLIIETFSPKKYESVQTFVLPQPKPEQRAQPPLKLEGRVEFEGDSVVVFVLLAERVRLLNREYFPSSERLRVMVYDAQGHLVWNSAEGRMFLQVIGAVEPQEIGGIQRYELRWGRRDRRGRRVPPGKYMARLILPIVPAPLQTEVEFTLGESDE